MLIHPFIAIIEDDVSFAHYLQNLFVKKGIHVLNISESVSEFVNKYYYEYEKLNCILLDVNLAGGEIGINEIPAIKKLVPNADVIVLTLHDEAKYIFQALCNGALGYLTKGGSFEEIYKSVSDVVNGGSAMTPSIARKVVEHFSQAPQGKTMEDLTAREYDVAIGIKDGLSYKLIADRYNITIDAVRFHVKNIYKKLHVNSKSEVVRFFYQNPIRK